MKPESITTNLDLGKCEERHDFAVPCLLVGLCGFLLAGCELRGKPNPSDRPIPSDQVLDFGKLFSQNCAGCHGTNGQLGPAPPLNDDLFRAIIPEKELHAILTQGRKDTLMPAFAQENGGTLTATQIQVLVKEIKGIDYTVIEKTPGDPSNASVVATAGGKNPAWGKPAKSPAHVPGYTHNASKSVNGSASATRAMAAFTRSCADCHGDHGQGKEEAHGMSNTINDPVFLSLNSDQVLRRIIITGRSDLGMPNYAEPRPDGLEFKPLTEQEVSDLVALLASWRLGAGPKAQPK